MSADSDVIQSADAVSLRILSAPKDGNDAGQYEDACAHTPLSGSSITVALADGASSAIFAREWANILTDALGVKVSFPDDNSAFFDIVAELGREWRRTVEAKATTWHAQES